MIPIILIAISSLTITGTEVRGDQNARHIIIEKALASVERNYAADEYRFALTARWIPKRLLETEPDNIISVNLQGSVRLYSVFEVSYKQHNRTEQTEIQLKVEAEQYLPVTVRRIDSGDTLSHEDFSSRWVPVQLGRDKPVIQLDKLIGKTLRRTVKAGQPIYSSEISSPYLVEAGENVDLYFSEYGIQIIMACEARQNGAINQDILIYCKETRKKYLGKIEGPGEAQWIKTQ